MITNEHVTKVYKMGEVDLTVIKDLNLSIGHGEFVAILIYLAYSMSENSSVFKK